MAMSGEDMPRRYQTWMSCVAAQVRRGTASRWAKRALGQPAPREGLQGGMPCGAVCAALQSADAQQIFFTMALMGLFLGYTLFTIYKRKKGMADAARMFFERTGYRYADILGQPVEAHLAHGEQLMKGASKGYRLHMVRDFHGLPIHSVQEYVVETGLTSSKTSTRYAWSVPLQQPARFHLQIAEKSLRGLAKGVKAAFSSSERVWNQQYPHEVTSGDPQFDGRFFVYADDPQAAYAALQAPALRQVLLQCTEVDLTVCEIFESRGAFWRASGLYVAAARLITGTRCGSAGIQKREGGARRAIGCAGSRA
jgi:hypothetical protein